MQIIQPKRSKFKKSTINYVQDNILDIIDIEETLSKNRYIEKVPISDFIYAKFLPGYNSQLKMNSPPKKQRHSLILNQLPKEKSTTVRQRKSFCTNIQTHKHFLNNINLFNEDTKNNPGLKRDKINFDILNDNKFDLKFDKLKIEYKNGYKVLFIHEYFPMKIIGTGAFGLVLMVIKIKTGKKMAVKIINKSKLNQSVQIDYLKNEVNILNYLDNPRIMKVYDILDNHRYFFIFMELIEGGNLKDLIIRRYLDNKKYLFRDSECALIMKGILEALNYLHKKNIIHRDIKPENILFKNKDDLSSVILCDFGLSYHLKNYETSITGSCGTIIYMAPEILLKRSYDYLVDSFSAGIVLFILCSGGMHPFYSVNKSRKEYINQLISQKCLCKFSLQMPLLARNLFLKLCKFETMNRYEPFKALNHPWITRSKKSQIPMTIIEEYNKSEKIKIFRGLLSVPLALIILHKFIRRNSENEDKSLKMIYKNPSKTINNTHQLLNLKDKYLLFSDVKRRPKIIFNDNATNDEEDKERKTGRNKLASINISQNNKITKHQYKIQDYQSSNINKNHFIKTGLTYHTSKNLNNINQNYITDLKSTVRTHSSKENINLKESLRLSKLKKNQKKSAAHIIINNLKINKDKERSNTNIHRNKIYASEKKNNNENNIQNYINFKSNIMNSNNKLLLNKHIIIESKNKRNDSGDIKKNNNSIINSNRNNYNNENTNFAMILDKNKSNLNTRINLQMKFRDNSNKLNIQKHKGKTNILKEVYNNEDF